MIFFHFLMHVVMNFFKGIVSICHSFRSTGQPGRIHGLDRCFQVVDRCTARRHRAAVTPVEDDCEDVYSTGLLQRYVNRTASLEHLTLADWAAWYDSMWTICKEIFY